MVCSCGSQKEVTFKEFEGRKLVLSHGGGFTGKYNTYYLLENGQLYKGSGDLSGSSSKVKSLEKYAAKQIFSNYDVLGLKDIKVQAYGNLNYSVTMLDDEGKHYIKWDKGQEGSEKLQLFYRSVMNVISLNNSDGDVPKNSKIKAKF